MGVGLGMCLGGDVGVTEGGVLLRVCVCVCVFV